MPEYENELNQIQKGYEVEEKALIRIGWEQALKLLEEKLKSTNTDMVQCCECEKQVKINKDKYHCKECFNNATYAQHHV